MNIINKMSGLLVILFMSLSTTMANLANGTRDSRHVLDIQKRWLNWNKNKDIVSNQNSRNNMQIDYFIPHERNDKILDNMDYMAFTLYKRNGQVIEENAGVFHFVETKEAENLIVSSDCSRKTRHAGAYLYFYGNCPEDDTNIVASGYCYRGTLPKRSLVFHSYTFNSADMEYLDGQYYVGTSNEMNSIEESLISTCFNSWKDANFPVTSWRCATQGIPLAKRSTREQENARFKRSETCSECDCSDVSGAWRSLPLTLWTYFWATFMLQASFTIFQ